MNRVCWPLAGLLLCLLVPSLEAAWLFRPNPARINRRMHGTVLDFTNNHGADRRLWSEALHQKRDLYVYLPPGFNAHKQYPAVLWLHGIAQDELSFLDLIEYFDRAISQGRLTPCIVIAPDGSILGRPTLLNGGSFFINSQAGDFEDYVIDEVWKFAVENFPIRPEREAHVIAGASMGGFAAYNLAFKHPEKFKTVIGIMPPLNLRWVDCHDRYFRNFDPCCWGWLTQLKPHEAVGRFLGGLIRVPQRRLSDPLFGRGPDAIARIAYGNPIEMLDRLGIQDGQFNLYVGYAGRDQFNIDAQVESFLYVARERGITVEVGYEPRGRHNLATGIKFFPGILDWLAPQLAPYRVSE